jgi:protein-tyrosine phosphatase
MKTDQKIKVLFVCLGNICRSPTAEAVFKKMVADKNLVDQFVIDSAGTIGNHTGENSDPRTIKHGTNRGYTFDHLARKVSEKDFENFDYIFAMDPKNLSDLKSMVGNNSIHAKIHLITELNPQNTERGIPDPYYGGPNDFEHVIDLAEECSKRWLEKIINS